jgi:hypothetical protein
VTEPGLQAGLPPSHAPDLRLGTGQRVTGALWGHIAAGANALSSASGDRPLASGTRWPYGSTVVAIDL